MNKNFTEIIQNKKKYINWKLLDFGDNFDRSVLAAKVPAITIVKDIIQEDNCFKVIGEKFCCGGDFQFLNIVKMTDNSIKFMGYHGHEWEIKNINDYCSHIWCGETKNDINLAIDRLIKNNEIDNLILQNINNKNKFLILIKYKNNDNSITVWITEYIGKTKKIYFVDGEPLLGDF
jgi:hypothetical protein